MRNVKFCFNVNERKIYNAEEIIKNFSDYFGIEFLKMKNQFKNYVMITKEEIVNYIKDNPNKMSEVDSTSIPDIIATRMVDYEYLKKVLTILSRNAIIYLSSLEYMANIKDLRDQNEEVEKLLEGLNIYHLGKAITGESVNHIFLELAHLITPFQDTLEKINCFETYHRQTLDGFMINYMGDRIYPVSLVDPKTNCYFNEGSFILKMKSRSHQKKYR